jgi:hypothetical protein
MNSNKYFFILLFFLPLYVFAQLPTPPENGGMIKSLGQPSIYNLYTGFSLGRYHTDTQEQLNNIFKLGLYRDLMNPVVGILGIAAEGYVGHKNVDFDYGIRGNIVFPVLHLSAGVDYNFPNKSTDFILTIQHPIIRGGFFRTGMDITFSWLPTRNHSLQLGFNLPLFQPNKGKTRPRYDHIRITPPPKEQRMVKKTNQCPQFQETIKTIKSTSYWINRLINPNFDQNGWTNEKAMANFKKRVEELKNHLSQPNEFFSSAHTIEDEVRKYHHEVDMAFTLALSNDCSHIDAVSSQGKMVASKAKEIILDDIIIPYDRYLGLIKKEDSILKFGQQAKGAFTRWIYTKTDIEENNINNAIDLFQILIDIFEENRKFSHDDWDDSRQVWLPLQYALLPEQHDTQPEIDAIIEKAVRIKFTEGNYVWYIKNDQFQWEFHNGVLAAKDYHVLWIHDVRGVTEEGDPDEMAFVHVVSTYMEALRLAVEKYDSTGTIPTYFIFLDEIFYEVNKGRLWMTFLENPLEETIRFPKEFSYMDSAVKKARQDLWLAINHSKLLQMEIQQYGKKWLKNRIKVQVNITNPADASFWSNQILPLIGIPDNLMRDHRKIAFYDITEEDPYKGMAIFTGMGIGEHYVGASWEDRAIMAQGPAVLSLKKNARTLLFNQGFSPKEIPYPLLAKEKPDNYKQIIENRRKQVQLSRALELQNQTGYRSKPINFLKALLYTLMPKGSVLKIPDSLWNSPLWGGMLVSASLRGVRVFIIAPSLECAPSAGTPQMSRAYELLSRNILMEKLFRDEISYAGGMLKTGIYNPNVDVDDIRGKVRIISNNFKKYKFLRDLYNFDPSVYAVFADTNSMFKNYKIKRIIKEKKIRRPKLHSKAQFFSSAQGWEKLLTKPGWAKVIHLYLLQEIQHTRDENIYYDVKKAADELIKTASPMILDYYSALTPQEQDKAIYYLTVGSHNEDYRGVMLDGEALFVVSGFGSLYGLIDFAATMGLCDWMDSVDQLNKVLPAPSEWQRRLARMIKIAL